MRPMSPLRSVSLVAIEGRVGGRDRAELVGRAERGELVRTSAGSRQPSEGQIDRAAQLGELGELGGLVRRDHVEDRADLADHRIAGAAGAQRGDGGGHLLGAVERQERLAAEAGEAAADLLVGDAHPGARLRGVGRLRAEPRQVVLVRILGDGAPHDGAGAGPTASASAAATAGRRIANTRTTIRPNSGEGAGPDGANRRTSTGRSTNEVTQHTSMPAPPIRAKSANPRNAVAASAPNAIAAPSEATQRRDERGADRGGHGGLGRRAHRGAPRGSARRAGCRS